MDKYITFYPQKFESEKLYGQKHFSDCVFQLHIFLSKPLWIFGNTSKTLPPFEMKFSQVSLIIHQHYYTGLKQSNGSKTRGIRSY